MMWELDDFIFVAQAFLILHNSIVRMQRNSDFRDESGGENLITAFQYRDRATAAGAAPEYEANHQRIRRKLQRIGGREALKCVMNDVQYMEF